MPHRCPHCGHEIHCDEDDRPEDEESLKAEWPVDPDDDEEEDQNDAFDD